MGGTGIYNCHLSLVDCARIVLDVYQTRSRVDPYFCAEKTLSNCRVARSQPRWLGAKRKGRSQRTQLARCPVWKINSLSGWID